MITRGGGAHQGRAKTKPTFTVGILRGQAGQWNRREWGKQGSGTGAETGNKGETRKQNKGENGWKENLQTSNLSVEADDGEDEEEDDDDDDDDVDDAAAGGGGGGGGSHYQTPCIL